MEKRLLKPTSTHFLAQPFWRYLRRFLDRKSWNFLYTVSQKIKSQKLLKLILNNNFEMPSNLISVYNGVKYFKTDKKISTLLKDRVQSPNFFDGQRVHLIINKMIISSKKKRKIYV